MKIPIPATIATIGPATAPATHALLCGGLDEGGLDEGFAGDREDVGDAVDRYTVTSDVITVVAKEYVSV